jgi:predicted RNase H-like HicB family nuclease
MTRKYSLVIEGGPGSYSAYVSELPTILVTGKTEAELLRHADEAIKFFMEEVGPDPSTSAVVREIEVELPEPVLR